jgi:hypothetical protein
MGKLNDWRNSSFEKSRIQYGLLIVTVGPSRSFQHFGVCKSEVWKKTLVARTPEARSGLSRVGGEEQKFWRFRILVRFRGPKNKRSGHSGVKDLFASHDQRVNFLDSETRNVVRTPGPENQIAWAVRSKGGL